MDQEERQQLWGKGPWLNEPDELSWSYHGIACVIERVELGHLCGYVGVSKLHPWYGLPHNTIKAYAHGGINYSKFEGDDGLWWVGFDCGHVDRDISPGLVQRLSNIGPNLFERGTYKTWSYVEKQVAMLAREAEFAVIECWLKRPPIQKKHLRLL